MSRRTGPFVQPDVLLKSCLGTKDIAPMDDKCEVNPWNCTSDFQVGVLKIESWMIYGSIELLLSRDLNIFV